MLCLQWKFHQKFQRFALRIVVKSTATARNRVNADARWIETDYLCFMLFSWLFLHDLKHLGWILWRKLWKMPSLSRFVIIVILFFTNGIIFPSFVGCKHGDCQRPWECNCKWVVNYSVWRKSSIAIFIYKCPFCIFFLGLGTVECCAMKVKT